MYVKKKILTSSCQSHDYKFHVFVKRKKYNLLIKHVFVRKHLFCFILLYLTVFEHF